MRRQGHGPRWETARTGGASSSASRQRSTTRASRPRRLRSSRSCGPTARCAHARCGLHKPFTDNRFFLQSQNPSTFHLAPPTGQQERAARPVPSRCRDGGAPWGAPGSRGAGARGRLLRRVLGHALPRVSGPLLRSRFVQRENGARDELSKAAASSTSSTRTTAGKQTNEDAKRKGAGHDGT